ncbi:MAG: peptidylprolyl isomerase [Alphaproteobacteria bacterium]|nr:peptidylprolyl isomerase [Alphaproteobacteria bacterium]MDE2500006.1 peptidylprolyl isomerase [Alphaproteobacteria bacterium]
MKRTLFLLTAALWLAAPAFAQETAPATGGPEATMVTSLGTIVIALDSAKAPATVANFIRYAKSGHYDKTVFYRVVPGFVLQAGSYDIHGLYRKLRKPIPLESGNGLSNVRGAVAMARDPAKPASATAEFFIDLDDRDASGLDPKPGDAPNTTGYAVFGHVVQGMDVADKIAAVPVGGGKGPFPDQQPVTPVVIEKVTIGEATPEPAAQPAPVQ